MTDFRNYIYRLAEGVSGKPYLEPGPGYGGLVPSLEEFVAEALEDRQPTKTPAESRPIRFAGLWIQPNPDDAPIAPTKTPAGWRYDA